MHSTKIKQRTIMSKTDYTCTETHKQSLQFIVFCLLKAYDADLLFEGQCTIEKANDTILHDYRGYVVMLLLLLEMLHSSQFQHRIQFVYR